jgi:hypothetical protein
MRPGIAVFALVFLFAAPASAAERFASPSGSGSACTQAAPCLINQALVGASDGDTVTALAGSYALTSRLSITKKITFRGEPGQLPTISGDGADFSGSLIQVFTDGVTIRGLQLKIRSAPNSGISSLALELPGGNVAEGLRVIAEQAGNGLPAGVSITGNSLLRDSMVIARGSNSIAVSAGNAKLLNTTITSDNIGVFGSPCSEISQASVTVTLVNSIVHGGDAPAGRDLRGGSGIQCNVMGPNNLTATIAPSASNYRSTKTEGPVTPPPGATNQIDNAPSLDSGLLQLDGSPTIDAGVADPGLGATDFEGQARTQGTAVDIGADEFLATTPAPGGSGGGTPTTPTPPTTPNPPVTAPPAADKLAPALSGLKLPALKSGKSAKFGFTLTEAATIKIAFTRLIPGRKVGGKCKEKARKGKKCTIAKALGTLTVAGKAGSNSVSFNGKLKGKKLPVGSYKVTITAVDAAGNKSKAKTVSVKVTR